jgi:hypothetical protein
LIHTVTSRMAKRVTGILPKVFCVGATMPCFVLVAGL